MEEEAREEERKKEEEQRRKEEERRRSQTVREKQREPGRSSRSLPRGRAPEEEEEEQRAMGHSKHAGSSASPQKAAFSFLLPMNDEDDGSESAASFSEASQSAASVTTAGWREDSDWRRAESPWQQEDTPGPWLKPTTQRLSQVLIGSRLGGRGLAGGLSL